MANVCLPPKSDHYLSLDTGPAFRRPWRQSTTDWNGTDFCRKDAKQGLCFLKEADMAQGPTRRIAELIVGTELSNVSPDALRIAKDCFFDTVGVTLGGRTQPAAKKVISFVRAMGGTPTATVIGAGFQTSPWAAALANGTSAATLDYDDNTWRGLGHFSGPNVSAILALAEARGLSGRAVLEAHVIGFETANKIGRGLQPGQYMGGRHASGTIGVLSATAACTKLLGLDTATTAVSLGIAASAAGALRGNFGTMTKGFHSGMAASNAIMAASLAADGFTARPDIIEITYGFADTTVRDSSYRLEEIGEDWGNPWDFVQPGAGIKFQPSGSMSFCAAQVAMELAIEHNIRPEEIESVSCRTSALAMELGHFEVPRDVNEAQYSIPWAVAVAITDRKRGLAQFSADRIKDAKVLALTKKVEMSLHPDLATLVDIHDLAACDLAVTMKDGRQFSKFQRRPMGYPGGEPWTAAMLDEKFRETASLALAPHAVEQAMTMLRDIEGIHDIRELTAVLRGSNLQSVP